MIRHLRNLGYLRGAAFVVVGAICVAITASLVRDVALWVDSWGWRTATGVVTSTRYLPKDILHEVNYRYEVDGEWYRGEAYRSSERRVGDPLRVLYNPESPDESTLQRSDLLGIDHFLNACYLAILSILLWTQVDELRAEVRQVRGSTARMQAEETALRAYFGDVEGEAVACLEELRKVLDAAREEVEFGSPAYQRLARSEVLCLGRLARLHRGAGRVARAEACVQAAFERAQTLANYGPLDPPIEHSGQVFAYVEAADRLLAKRYGRDGGQGA